MTRASARESLPEDAPPQPSRSTPAIDDAEDGGDGQATESEPIVGEPLVGEPIAGETVVGETSGGKKEKKEKVMTREKMERLMTKNLAVDLDAIKAKLVRERRPSALGSKRKGRKKGKEAKPQALAAAEGAAPIKEEEAAASAPEEKRETKKSSSTEAGGASAKQLRPRKTTTFEVVDKKKKKEAAKEEKRAEGAKIVAAAGEDKEEMPSDGEKKAKIIREKKPKGKLEKTKENLQKQAKTKERFAAAAKTTRGKQAKAIDDGREKTKGKQLLVGDEGQERTMAEQEMTKEITKKETKRETKELTKEGTKRETKELTREETKRETKELTREETRRETKELTREETRRETKELTKEETKRETKELTREETKRETKELTKEETKKETIDKTKAVREKKKEVIEKLTKTKPERTKEKKAKETKEKQSEKMMKAEKTKEKKPKTPKDEKSSSQKQKKKSPRAKTPKGALPIDKAESGDLARRAKRSIAMGSKKSLMASSPSTMDQALLQQAQQQPHAASGKMSRLFVPSAKHRDKRFTSSAASTPSSSSSTATLFSVDTATNVPRKSGRRTVQGLVPSSLQSQQQQQQKVVAISSGDIAQRPPDDKASSALADRMKSATSLKERVEYIVDFEKEGQAPKTVAEDDLKSIVSKAKGGAGAKGKKKKKTKKMKKAKKPVSKKVEEKNRQEQEALARQRAEEEQQRVQEERKMAVQAEKQEVFEQQLRREQYEATAAQMEAARRALWDVYARDKEEEKWDQYLVCDGLPDPSDVAAMNTYLHLWEKETPTVSVEQAKKRTAEAIGLLEKLQEFIDDPFDESPSRQQDWLWIRRLFREHQSDNIEFCTYRLLRDIKTNLNRISIPTADFRVKQPLWAMGLYVWLTLPTPIANPRAQTRPRIHLSWTQEMSMDALFPTSVKCDDMAIRGAYLRYDHLTDTASTFADPPVGGIYTKDLLELNEWEYRTKMKYKFDNRLKSESTAALAVAAMEGHVSATQIGAVAAAIEDENATNEIPEGSVAPTVPYRKLEPSASQFLINRIDDEILEAKSTLTYFRPHHVVNLRQFNVLGGVYSLDLFKQPPQPQGMVSHEVFMSTLMEPHRLQKADFEISYQPPPPIAAGTRRSPEEIEEEMLQLEKELDELIFVTIDLPKHVYYMDVPQVVVWSRADGAWVNNRVHDYKHVEEKGFCTFRLGVFAPFAFSTPRWLNLPYQAWEIRPEKDGSVTFQLTAAILTLEFHVAGHKICIKDIQNAPNGAFDAYINVYFKFPKLKRIMKDIGIDIFPYFDTFDYVAGTCEKLWPLEHHTYFCMALCSVVFDMTWSRWNMTVQSRPGGGGNCASIVFQMRAHAHDRPKQANYETVLVTESRTTYIECTEVSAEFSSVPVEGTKFDSDLLHLVKMTATMATKSRIQNANMAQVQTLFNFYSDVRFLSFS